jgi:hypothetical protein
METKEEEEVGREKEEKKRKRSGGVGIRRCKRRERDGEIARGGK